MSGAHPWVALPPSMAEALRPVLPRAVDATVTAIRAEVPPYRRAWRDQVDQTVRRGVDMALIRMLELFGTDHPALDRRAQQFYRRLGQLESDQGRTLDALLSAYRSGARVNWELMSATVVEAGVDTADLIALAESIFVYIDQLSSASAAGHAAAEVARSGQRDVLRAQLAEELLEGAAATSAARIRELADSARWRLPSLLVVAVVPIGGEPPGSRLLAAPPEALVLQRSDEVVAIIPDPTGPGRAAALTRWAAGAGLFPGAEVFVGTVRPPAEAALSLEHARRLRRLAADGMVQVGGSDGPGGVVLAVRHLPELILTADPVLQRDLSSRALAPLEAVSPSRRPALRETLAAWLAHAGDRAAIAAALVVHPQTVSYRMQRLHQLFGAALQDPRERLELQIALAVPEPASADGLSRPDRV